MIDLSPTLARRIKASFLLLLAVLLSAFFVIYTWLWQHNRSIDHPLPLFDGAQTNTSQSNANEAVVATNTVLNVVATPILENSLNEALPVFSSRFPDMTVNIEYLPANEIRAYIKAHSDVGIVLADESTVSKLDNQQTLENEPQASSSQSQLNQDDDTVNHVAIFQVALKADSNRSNIDEMSESQLDNLVKLQGFILPSHSDDASVTSFRNFLLASSTQRYFNTDKTLSIEPYQNSVDDLFNPNGNPPADTPVEKIAIAEAIDSERERDNEAVELVE